MAIMRFGTDSTDELTQLIGQTLRARGSALGATITDDDPGELVISLPAARMTDLVLTLGDLHIGNLSIWCESAAEYRQLSPDRLNHVIWEGRSQFIRSYEAREARLGTQTDILEAASLMPSGREG